MQLTVLFWNYNHERGDRTRSLGSSEERASIVAGLARDYAADLVVLTECSIPKEIVLNLLRGVDNRFELPLNLHEKFQFYTRFPSRFLEPFEEDGRVAIRRLKLDGFDDVLLAAIHYLDRRNNSPDMQWREIRVHRDTLIQAEKKAGHRRTVLFGDLNMNPFDKGMIDPVFGLGAMMTRELASIHSNGKKKRPCFYNPMWSLMGRPEAPGTYYWNSAEPSNPYWNCLDGVLFRPELMRHVRDEDIHLIRWLDAGGERIDLLRLAKIHWKIAYSDHLPLVFKFSLPAAAIAKGGHHVP